MPVFTYCSLITLSYSNTRRQLIRKIEHRGLSCISSGLENKTDIRIPSVDSYLKRKVSLCVFDCLLGNACTPFKNYFKRVNHTVNTRNRFSSIELPKMKLEFGRRSFSFLAASVFNSLPSDMRNLNSRLLFKGEVHSRMAIYFLYSNKKVIQKYVIHQNFSFQRALNPYEIFL